MQKISQDDFSLLTLIGKNASSKVLQVRKNDNKEIYVMKILKKKKLQKIKHDYVFADKSIRVEVKHPFIIKMFYSFQSNQKLFFVLEYCQGGELFNLLQKHKVFTENQARFYAAQILLALEHLHNHDIIYRALKLENILIDAQGYIRITDFELLKLNVKPSKDANNVWGKPEYFAPEILLTGEHGTPSDWWTLGAIIFEMLSGFPPFYTQNRQELFESIKSAQLKYPVSLTPTCKSLLEGLFSKDPEIRLGAKSAQEIKDHPWFFNVNWDILLKKLYKPPFIPLVKGETYVSKFDLEFTEQPIDFKINI